MSRNTKKLLVSLVIIIISLLVILSLFKIAQAPFFQLAKEPAVNTVNNKLPLIAEKKSIEFIFGGDVMLSRQVNNKMAKYNDYSWPFLKIAEFLKSADLTIINLESPFLIIKDYSVLTGSFLFKANLKAIEGLLSSGIDLASLANNHILNQGRQGLKDTFKILNDKEIKYIGAGNNDSEAHQGEIVIINNQKFGFLGYAYPEDNSVAGENSAGIADMNLEKMKSDVKRLKEQGAAVIVMMHAGTEYALKPNQQQITFAHGAIEAGAEVVIGHHPHIAQTFEFYQGKPVFYSLGNLVFDQMWSQETRQGMLAKMTWDNGWNKIELVPIKIYDYGQSAIIPDGTEKKEILKKIGAPEDGVIKK